MGILDKDERSMNYSLSPSYVAFYDRWYQRGSRVWRSYLVSSVIKEIKKKRREKGPEAHRGKITSPLDVEQQVKLQTLKLRIAVDCDAKKRADAREAKRSEILRLWKERVGSSDLSREDQRAICRVAMQTLSEDAALDETLRILRSKPPLITPSKK